LQLLWLSGENTCAHRAYINVSEFIGRRSSVWQNSRIYPYPAFEWLHFPMLRHFAQPLHARVFIGGVGLAGADINLAGDRLVDEGLLVLLQQLV
jgi:hypothetical protein